MAYDYADDQAFALAEVEEYGRIVTIQRLASAPQDPTKPWEGSSGPAGVVASHDLPMVFVPPSSATQLGLRGLDEALLKRFEQLAICGPGPNFTEDLRLYDQLLDLDTTWRILWSETLRPGPVNVLYFFGVAR